MIAGVASRNAPAPPPPRPWGVATLDADERVAQDPATGSWLALSGRLGAEADAGSPAAAPGEKTPRGEAGRLLARLLARGPDALAQFDGALAGAFWDGRSRRLILFRDAFGIEPLFYCESGGEVAFGSRVAQVLASGLAPGGICPQGLVEFLTYGYAPGDATLDRGIRKVPPGSLLVCEPGRGVLERRRWYRLSFASPHAGDETAIAREFAAQLERAVARRLSQPPAGAFLSGGMDSSSVVTFARRHYDGPFHTFAFRCGGASFDESQYARALAEHLGAEHVEVEYGEAQALAKERAVREMDVPFCDIGIVAGSWILGEAARGRVGWVLTGDGGDEMWGSHPVYAAQRLLDRVPLPRALHRAFQRLASRLPDSANKRDLRVKLKRILPDEALPEALGPFRWRAYSGLDALREILTPEAEAEVRDRDPFRCVIEAYEGYDGPDDGLSPHLYNDYATASSFYFSRLRLLRAMGIEARCPFYDRALVEFGARIPARLKLEGIERTKRLFRVAMKGILLDAINDRKDKLGHSVPLKNWLRGAGPLASRLDAVLSPEALRRRGLFRPEAVARLLDEHRRLRHNHSHRLWSLYVLECWLGARER